MFINPTEGDGFMATTDALVNTTATFIDSTVDATAQTTYTLVMTGTFNGERAVVAFAANGPSAQTLNSITLDGVNCTEITSPSGGIGVSSATHMLLALSDSAISATNPNLVATFAGANMSRAGGAAWSLQNLISSTPDAGPATSTADPLALDLTISVGATIIAAGYVSSNSTATFDWTASDAPFAEDFDAGMGGRTFSGGHGNFSTSGAKNIDGNPSTGTVSGASIAYR